MQITTKTEYAVRALSELASSSDGKPLSIAHICKAQSLPAKYMEQIFRKLKQNNLVTSIQGSQGGYLPVENFADISLKDIVQSVEDRKAVCDCDTIDYCSGNPCGLQKLWNEIQNNIDDYFEQIKFDKILSFLRKEI